MNSVIITIYLIFLFSLFRVGGFHLLKSYLGSLGYIMDNSGLLELIQLIDPGSMTADQILMGGCFCKAICAKDGS